MLWTHLPLLHPPFLPWSFPTKNSALPGSGGPGSKEGMMLSLPSHAQGSDFSQSDRKGHWPWRSHSPSSHGHPQKHPPISLIFPHNREKQQVSLTAQSCPQRNIMRFWLERILPAWAFNTNNLSFQQWTFPLTSLSPEVPWNLDSQDKGISQRKHLPLTMSVLSIENLKSNINLML